MKKILLLVFLSFNSFSQVFYLDTTFVAEPLVKPFAVQEPSINQFPNGLLYLKTDGNVINDELKGSGIFLLNADGKFIKNITNETLISSNYRLENCAITPDNNLFITQVVKASSCFIMKISQDGVVDTTFKFNSYKPYISKIALLKNENFVLFFQRENGTLAHELFDKNGKFIRAIDPSTFTSAQGAQLTEIIYNDLNEYFLLFIDNKRNAEIIKTNADFEIDKSFSTVKLSGAEAYMHRLVRLGNDFVMYQLSIEGVKNKLEKFDRNGAKVWNVSFDRITDYPNGVNFFAQTDGSIDLIYFDNKHLKITANGEVDPIFNDKKPHEHISFFYAFADGSYWIMQNKSGIIEKMHADGSIDKNFKIVIQAQKQLFPNQLLKLSNNTYLLDFYNYTYDNSPYSIRYSPYPNAVQVYNSKHKLLHDFFDGKTIWKTYKTKNSLVVRGDGKFYRIDEANKVTISKDTLEANDVIDWDNNFIYRKIKNDSIIRYEIGKGLDKSFLIKDQKIRNFSILDDKRIAVETSENPSAMETKYYIKLYQASGVLDTSFKTIVLDDAFFKFYGELPMSVKSANGLIINQMTVGEFGNIVKQRFLRYDSNGNPDKNYQSNIYRGGYFRQFEKDGSIFMNTANEIKEYSEEITYNFLKITPNGRIDSTFTLLGTNSVYGFELFDENTLYAVGQKNLQRFIRQPLKTDEYFQYKALPSEMAWNIALPRKLIINTNIKHLQVEVSGNGSFKNDFISFEPKAGTVSITITDNTNRVLAKQKIELTRIYPHFIYDESRFSMTQEPFEFKVQSSSGLPVKISIDGGNEYIGSIIIDPKKDRTLKLKLRTEKNEQYEALETTIILEKLIPLATESESQNYKVLYYPNPVTDKLIIKKDNLMLDTIKLINIDGKERETAIQEYADRFELGMRNLEHGLYMLVLRNKNGQFVYRILKE